MAFDRTLESADKGDAEVRVKERRYIPKVFAMKEYFRPPVEKQARLETQTVLETQVPAIRLEIRPGAPQERLHEQARRARIERMGRQKVRIERLRMEAANARELAFYVREQERIHEQAKLAISVLAVLGTFGALSVAILEGQAIVASVISALEGFLAVAPAVLFETLHGFLSILAAGDPTFTAATLFVGFSLLVATCNMIVSGQKVKEERRKWSY